MKEVVILFCLVVVLTIVSFYFFLWVEDERLPLLDPPVGFVGVPEPTDSPDVLNTLSGPRLEELAEQAWGDRTLDPDRALAVRLFSMAFAKGALKRSGYRLGVAYYRGLGTPKDFKKAHHFLSLPILRRHRYARYHLGLLLADPTNPDRDVEGAKAALREAEAMGLKEATEALKTLR
jgi:hypothetical protein